MIAPVDKTQNLWRTPKGDTPLDSRWTLNKLIKQFKLELDPCCSGPDDAMCKHFYTPKQDGLKQPWTRNAIFNPPFSVPVLNQNGKQKIGPSGEPVYRSAIGDWCEKAIHEVIEHDILAVGILPFYNSRWFREYVWDVLPKGAIYLFDRRISYLDQNDKPSTGNRFDSFLAFWGRA